MAFAVLRRMIRDAKDCQKLSLAAVLIMSSVVQTLGFEEDTTQGESPFLSPHLGYT